MGDAASAVRGEVLVALAGRGPLDRIAVLGPVPGVEAPQDISQGRDQLGAVRVTDHEVHECPGWPPARRLRGPGATRHAGRGGDPRGPHGPFGAVRVAVRMVRGCPGWPLPPTARA